MNFDLTAEDAALRDRARTFARERVRTEASSIDRHAVVPADLLREIEHAQLIPAAPGSALVAVVEELGAESASAAVCAAFRGTAHLTKLDSPGLRGVSLPDPGDARARLVLAGAALGVGRCAIDTAIDVLRGASAAQHDSDKPHWVLADAATELEAARLLAYDAARAAADEPEAGGPAAAAKLAATAAASRAVDAALRVVGPDGYAQGTLLERLTRDARALTLVLGTEEDLRAAVAADWFRDQTGG